MNALRSLNVTRLALHHISHAAAGNGNGSSAPTGSRYFRNAARCLWEIQRSPISPDLANVGLYNRKMNDDGKREQPIAWQMDYGEHRGDPIILSPTTLADDPGLLKSLSIGDQIVVYLKAHNKANVGKLAEVTRATPKGVRNALNSSSRFVELNDGQLPKYRSSEEGGSSPHPSSKNKNKTALPMWGSSALKLRFPRSLRSLNFGTSEQPLWNFGTHWRKGQDG